MTINIDLTAFQSSVIARLEATTTVSELEALRVELLGKKSLIQASLAQLGKLPQAERKQAGEQANRVKGIISAALDAASQRLANQAEAQLSGVDLSQPITIAHQVGHIHPTQAVLADVYDIFLRLGYAVVDGPEIETDWYNFEVLNMPADHPAREMQDTFYLQSNPGQAPLVPRTHTSAAQIRYMSQRQPPFKVIVPGKVYRNEDEDRTHLWSFYQVEGLVVGEDVSMADLKGTLLHVMQELFDESVKIRFRPSYFPYTEPSVEVDVWYRDEWLEICGAGMVHPDVLEKGGINPELYSGFAFGFGPDRLTVIRYGLSDIRMLWRPNLLTSRQV